MPRKGENIRKRKDGRWEARVFDGFKYKSIYAHSYQEIKNKKLKYSKNELKQEYNIKFSKASENWLIYMQTKIKESSYARYKFLLERYILPKLGHLKISQISNTLLSLYSSNLLTNGSLRNDEKLSPKTVSDIMSVIKNILNYHHELFDINAPMLRIKYPKVYKTKINVLSENELKKIETKCQEINKPYCIGILLSIYLGLRIGEICALKWEDINISAGYISINKTMQRVSQNGASKVLVDNPKTEASNRVIPIPSFITSNLNKNKKDNNFYVLTGSVYYMEPRTYYAKYKKLMKSIKLDNYNYHCLRHTFATKCIDSGFDIKTLSEILGHSNINTTLRIYVHPTMQMKRKQMNKIKSLLWSK